MVYIINNLHDFTMAPLLKIRKIASALHWNGVVMTTTVTTKKKTRRTGRMVAVLSSFLFFLFVMNTRSNNLQQQIYNKYDSFNNEINIGFRDTIDTIDTILDKSKSGFNTDNNYNPRIVILAGPHKTASTTIQSLMVNFAGQTISLEGRKRPTKKSEEKGRVKHYHKPHPSNHDLVWPIGYVGKDYDEPLELCGMLVLPKTAKFYAPLVGLLVGRRTNQWMNRKINHNSKQKQKQLILQYCSNLFRRVWNNSNYDTPSSSLSSKNSSSNNNNKSKKIVFGAEALDTLVKDLYKNTYSINNNRVNDDDDNRGGENLHISSSAGPIIDSLLSILPFDDGKLTRLYSDINNQQQRQQPSLKLDDIEVVVNYRTPRIGHLKSIWHQLGRNSTLKEFLTKSKTPKEKYQLNSLALALQFVKKGIKTTIIDMKGVAEKEKIEQDKGTQHLQRRDHQQGEEKRNNNNFDQSYDNDIDNEKFSFSHPMKTTLEFGGLEAVVVCNIMKSDMCNEDGRLVFPIDEVNDDTYQRKFVHAECQNTKRDSNNLDLTEKQLHDIEEEIMVEYDCCVWTYLQKYVFEGALRVLYPSQSNTANIFNNKSCTCIEQNDNDSNSSEGNGVVTSTSKSFQWMYTKIYEIAS